MFRIAVTEGTGTPTVETIGADEVLIGRVKGNDIVLPTGNVSKRHARIAFEYGRPVIYDLKSTNGTSVNGRKIVTPTPVGTSDDIQIGEFRLEILSASQSAPAPGLQDLTELGAIPPRAQAGASVGTVVPVIPGVLAPAARDQAPVVAAHVPPTERNAAVEEQHSPVRPPPPRPPLPNAQVVPASPALGAAPPPPVNRQNPPPVDSTTANVLAPTQVAAVETRPAAKPQMRAEVPSGSYAAAQVAGAAAPMTARVAMLPRETFWDDARFRRAWHSAAERLTDEVPADGLPRGFQPQPQVLRSFEELAARLVLELPEADQLNDSQVAALAKLVAHSAVGLGPIEAYLLDPRVQALTLTDDGQVELHLDAGGVTESIPAPIALTHIPLARRIRERLLNIAPGTSVEGFVVVSATARAASGPTIVRLQRSSPSAAPSGLVPFTVAARASELLKRQASMLVVIPESQRGTWTAVRAVVDSLDAGKKAWVAGEVAAAELKRQSIGSAELEALRWCPVPLILDASDPTGWVAWLRASAHVTLPTIAVVYADSLNRAMARVCLLTQVSEIGITSAFFDGVLRVVEDSGELETVTFQAGTPLEIAVQSAAGGGR